MEKDRESGRPKGVRLLNKYPDNLFFCYLVKTDVSCIDKAEKALIGAFGRRAMLNYRRR